ncbi:MAG: sigma-54 dependent transcriptional regulator [Pseudomonadota bacterium]
MSRRSEQTLLIVDSDPVARRLHGEALLPAGFQILQAESEDQAMAILADTVCAAIVLDATQFPGDVEAFMKAARLRDAGTVIISVSAESSMSGAVSAMRLGCTDVLAKPVAAARLRSAVKEALAAPIGRPAKVKKSQTPRRAEMIGTSPAMRDLTVLAERFAPSTAPVLITGESGTGKEVCAHFIHNHSDRAEGPFVALNCAALPRELMESEIFGHVRGAFTGAASDRTGAARAADGGTLFLDEVGEMDIALQAKLLRFLQTGEVKRVGSDAVNTVDVRIVCATNRNLPNDIAAGGFREDLYYRLNILSLHMPPLRTRGSDILALAEHFRAVFAEEEGKSTPEFDPRALEALANYAWPGNVRELQNIIRRAVVLSRAGPLTEKYLFPSGAHPQAKAVQAVAHRLEPLGGEPPLSRRLLLAVMRPLAEIEREVIEAVIAGCDGNLRKAADTLQVSPSTLYRKRDAWSAAGGSGEADILPKAATG